MKEREQERRVSRAGVLYVIGGLLVVLAFFIPAFVFGGVMGGMVREVAVSRGVNEVFLGVVYLTAPIVVVEAVVMWGARKWGRRALIDVGVCVLLWMSGWWGAVQGLGLRVGEGYEGWIGVDMFWVGVIDMVVAGAVYGFSTGRGEEKRGWRTLVWILLGACVAAVGVYLLFKGGLHTYRPPYRRM